MMQNNKFQIITICIISLMVFSIGIEAKQPDKYMPAFPLGADDFIMYAVAFLPYITLPSLNVSVLNVINTTVTNINMTGNLTLNDSPIQDWSEVNASTSGLVPYTGATQNVDLGGYNVSSNHTLVGNEEGDHCVYFYEDGSQTGARICWDDSSDYFYFDDTIQTSGGVAGGTFAASGNIYSANDIYTTGSGDDLWLGNIVQTLANLKAYANGTLQNVDIHTGSIVATGDITANSFNGSWNGSVDYNKAGYDIWVNESGDNVTGNLEMGLDANITDANSGSYMYFKPGGATIIHLGMT